MGNDKDRVAGLKLYPVWVAALSPCETSPFTLWPLPLLNFRCYLPAAPLHHLLVLGLRAGAGAWRRETTGTWETNHRANVEIFFLLLPLRNDKFNSN